MGAEKLQTEYLPVNDSDSIDMIDKNLSEEIIIGLCGQLGTDLTLVQNILENIFEATYKYECEIISMSNFIFKYTDYKPSIDEYERIVAGMNGGDELRKNYKNHILADLAITRIGSDRFQTTPPEKIEKRNFTSRRKCFIINSIKHPEEFSLFEKVYGSAFYSLGIFSSYEERVKNLRKKLKPKHYKNIDKLIDRDTGTDILNGQHVEEVFIKSDYFIRTSRTDKSLEDRLHNFMNLIFDFHVNTPTKEENAMYQATAASVNSACLSRQVGACITDKDTNILSVGWNDVPAFGGGVYQNGHSADKRCYKIGCCANSSKKEDMTTKIYNDLASKKLLTKKCSDEVKTILNNNGIKSLIEFARSIHAEMHAIIIGSQKTGDKMIGGKLFCTTYPCHNCARHIVLSGIKEVYFIEPYRKSLCIELHKDAITEKENKNEKKVRILMYEGVAPKSFIKFYQLIKDNRKTKMKEKKEQLKPKHMVQLEALHEREVHTTEYLKDLDLLDS